MANSTQVNNVYAFEDFRLEAAERRLYRGKALIALTPKTFDLLLFLVENEGRLLRKEDLLASVWPDAAVEENNLTVAVSALRKALGESGRRRFVETVPKTGYRFVAPVTKLPVEVIEAEDERIRFPEPRSLPPARAGQRICGAQPMVFLYPIDRRFDVSRADRLSETPSPEAASFLAITFGDFPIPQFAR